MQSLDQALTFVVVLINTAFILSMTRISLNPKIVIQSLFVIYTNPVKLQR